MSTKFKLTTLPAFKHCQMVHSPYYVSKRNAPGPRVPNIKPPVEEPNTPKSKVKKDKRKEEEKIKKPALYAKEKITNISQADQRAVDEMKNILHHKWGVKLSKDVALHNSDETSPAKKLMEEQQSVERVLRGIMRKTDVELDNFQIKRTRGETFKMDKISVLQTTEPEKTTSIGNQYNIPAEVKEGEEPKVWKNAAAKSTRRSIEKEPTPKELQVSESIFIRPEPPKTKSDEKSVKTP